MSLFKKAVAAELARRKQSPIQAALASGLNRDALRFLNRGSAPIVDRAEEICHALGLEFYIGPPRDELDVAIQRPVSPDERQTKWQSDSQTIRQVFDRLAALEAKVTLIEPDVAGEYITSEKVTTVKVLFARDVRAAAGSGAEVFEESADARVFIPSEALTPTVRPDRLIALRATGDSMEPSIHEGDILVIDRSSVDPVEGRAFVLRTPGGLVIKRLDQHGDDWLMSSENPAFPPRPVTEDDRVLGRVVWFGPDGAVEVGG